MKKNLEWQERFNIGVDIIDKEHQKLFSTMRKLLEISKNEKKSQWACKEGIKYFRSHAAKHFRDEEEYMQSINYSGYKVHKRLHDNFAHKTLPVLINELEEENYSIESVRHFLGVCIGWLTGHTMIEDQAITGKHEIKFDNIPPEEEVSAMGQTVISLINQMFNLDAHVVSEQYGGEDFGSSICCRLIFRSRNGEKWETLLVFEEQLLIKTASEMMSVKFYKVDDVVVNVTRYIARQFLEHLKECFSTIDLYKIESECLLTHEQLEQSFERERPRISLLFDTGIGYFAFCVNSLQNTDAHIGIPIGHENTMAEINNYLVAEDIGQKKKILVVDDSKTIRHSIMNLLEGDYLVTEADSGVSAIKCILRDRPDLVLLDYEMPVCDGRQTLAMIRGDKEMSDISVIFLTSRRDKDSVSKVKSLRPNGYLLKNMQLKNIKSKIDIFFEKKNRKK